MIRVILDPPNSAHVFMHCDVCGAPRERVVDGSAEKAFRARHAQCDPNWFQRGLDRAKQEVAEWPEWKRKAMMVAERKDESDVEAD